YFSLVKPRHRTIAVSHPNGRPRKLQTNSLTASFLWHWHIFRAELTMLKNYFKVAFRSLARNKVFSIINIFGLAIGLATCLLILTYIVSESGYDRQNKDADRIYRLAMVGTTLSGTMEQGWAGTPAP